MITVFNRKLIHTSFSMESQAKIKKALDHNGIKYHEKVISRSGNGIRSSTGRFGENSSYTYEYLIYVHEKDFESANKCICDHRD